MSHKSRVCAVLFDVDSSSYEKAANFWAGALGREIQSRLGPVAQIPYVVFHDAYRYFESRFGLRPAGSVVLSPGRKPGARRITAIRRKIRALRAACVFTEPQFSSGLINTVVEGTGARVAVLDPLGADIAPGPEMYFLLMRRLASSLRQCLASDARR